MNDFNSRFAALDSIGDGASSEVIRAEDPRIGRNVAVKVLRAEHREEAALVSRFMREIKSTGALEHPSIPPVYESGETNDGRPFMAMRLIEGQTLGEVIARLNENADGVHAEYTFSRRLQIALDLCNVLEYAHEEGVVHRDIKPENIMLGNHGEVWLVDWGLAAEPREEQLPDGNITAEHAFVGTLATAAPEQVGGVYSAQSDQYSLGVVLYGLFALRSPYKGESRYEILSGVLHDRPKPAESFVLPVQGRVPREISMVLKRMLEKRPEERFADIVEVKAEFERILSGDIRAICPHTFIKSCSHKIGRFMDTYNRWFAPLVFVWLLYPAIHILYWLIGKIFLVG